MKRNVRIRPAAQAEIDQQAEYLVEHAGEAIASRFLDAIFATVDTIAGSPGVGSPWITDHPKLQNTRKQRVSGFPNHLVFYQHDDRWVEILHLYHGMQDIDRRLSDEVDGAQ